MFPCNPATKQPLLPPDKGPDGKVIKGTGGLHKASTVEATIREWWRRWPKAMIGVPMGARSGVFAIDLDLGDPQLVTGDEYLERFSAFVERLPETAIAETASGGVHIYFRWENDHPVKNNGKRLVKELTIDPVPGTKAADGGPAKGAGIDCRGEGGYVIVPPSVRSDGKAYRWTFAPWKRGAADLNVAQATPAIYDVVTGKHAKGHDNKGESSRRVKTEAPPPKPAPARQTQPAGISRAPGEEAKRKYAEAALDLACADLRKAVPGERNNVLNATAFSIGTLVGAGALDEGYALLSLKGAAAEWPNFDKSQATIERGITAGKAKPRDLAEVAEKAERRAASPHAPPPADFGDYFEGNAPNLESVPMDYDAAADTEFAADEAAADHAALAGGSGGSGGSRITGRGPAGGGGRKRRDQEADDARQARLHPQLAFLPQTDLGNAERFVERNKGRFLYSTALGWLYWTGTHWSGDGADERVKIAEHETVRYIQEEAAWLAASEFDEIAKTMRAGKADEEIIKRSDVLAMWGRASEENRRLSPISKRAAPYLAVRTEQLDADPFKITVENGTLIVHRPGDGRDKAWIEFVPHDPRDLATRRAHVVYVPGAECPVYDKFLFEVQRDADMRRFLHQWGGMSLTADISEQRLVFFWGKGRNGKSTLLEIWAHVAGDYGAAAQIETFVNMGQQRNGGQATPDLAMLRGKRFIHTNEPERGAKISESLVKLVTGGDTFPARELHYPFFQMRIVGKITMSGNFKPRIEGGDASHGIWRRMTLVPWNITIALDKVDKALPEKLKREASGILNRLLAGLLDWLDNGLALPESVVEATEKYREDSDPLGRFLSACTEPGTDDDRVQSSELHKVFCAWAKINGEREWTATGLGRALNERQFKSFHSNVNYWLGIRLKVKADSHGLIDLDGKRLGTVSTDEKTGEPAPIPLGREPDDMEFS